VIIDYGAVDRFGVPNRFFGPHPGEFYGMIGRITCLSALLEHQLLVAYQTMTNSMQDEHVRLSAGQLLDRAQREVSTVRDSGAKQTLQDYLNRVGAALRLRNDFIHSLWPAQDGERLLGWRPSRAQDSNPAKTDELLETTLDEIKAFVQELVSLVIERDRAYSAAQVEQGRRIECGGSE